MPCRLRLGLSSDVGQWRSHRGQKDDTSMAKWADSTVTSTRTHLDSSDSLFWRSQRSHDPNHNCDASPLSLSLIKTPPCVWCEPKCRSLLAVNASQLLIQRASLIPYLPDTTTLFFMIVDRNNISFSSFFGIYSSHQTFSELDLID